MIPCQRLDWHVAHPEASIGDGGAAKPHPGGGSGLASRRAADHSISSKYLVMEQFIVIPPRDIHPRPVSLTLPIAWEFILVVVGTCRDLPAQIICHY